MLCVVSANALVVQLAKNIQSQFRTLIHWFTFHNVDRLYTQENR